MLTPKTVSYYFKFLQAGAYCTPPGRTICALRNAKTLSDWEMAERAGLVRLRAIPEDENYFDVYGRPDDKKEREDIESLLDQWGCYCIVSEVNHGNEQKSDWQHADSIGMCVYRRQCDPFENSYIIDLMSEALSQIPQPGNVDEIAA